MNLVVAIDDLHQEQGWGCEGDVQVDYLSSLNDEFGVKFTLFCPSYYHHKYKLTKGISDIKGGMIVLKQMNYPSEIIEDK